MGGETLTKKQAIKLAKRWMKEHPHTGKAIISKDRIKGYDVEMWEESIQKKKPQYSNYGEQINRNLRKIFG